jgi:diguanylate cyclase (GGDEF)-like protein
MREVMTPCPLLELHDARRRSCMPERLSHLLSALSVRFVVGTPHEDDRTRHARLAGILLLLGAAAGMGLLPVLPERVDQSLAFGLASLCLVVGGGITWLPWHRWPYVALIAPLVLAFPVVFAGGLLGGDLDYYALYFPLLFIYCGYTFPPRYTGGMFLLSMLGLGISTFTPQVPGSVPFVLLGSLLAAVCGVVLALQRQDEQRGQEAMRQLVEAASALGANKHPQQVARFIAATASDLLDAYGVAVLLPTAHGDDTVVSAAEGCLTAAGAEGDPADADLLALLRHGASTRTDVKAPPVGRPTGGDRPHVLVSVPLPRLEGETPAGSPATGKDGAIVCELRSPIRHRDYFTVRTLELLAVEGARVLERLAHAETLLERSRTDPLTRLGNRLVLDAALASSLPGDTVMLLDLDHFKAVNDRFGHASGDEVLVQFADVLRRTMRPGQVLTRYGGEEFALVIHNLPADGLMRHLSMVRREWAATLPLTTYSCGVAVQAPGETGPEALARADRAMYRAKGQGRDRDVLDLGEPALLDGVSA